MPTGIDHGLLVQALNQPVSASSLVKGKYILALQTPSDRLGNASLT